MKFGASPEGAPPTPAKGLAEKPKPKGALAALLVGNPGPAPEEMETDHGFRAVAKAFGIPPEREASAQAALKQYIRTCVESPEGDEPEEEY